MLKLKDIIVNKTIEELEAEYQSELSQIEKRTRKYRKTSTFSGERKEKVSVYNRLLEIIEQAIRIKKNQKLLFDEIEKEIINADKIRELVEEKGMETIIINEKVNGLTPLHLSISKDNEQIACILLENGADPEITDDLGNNSFHYAAKRGNLQMLQLLESEYNEEVEKKPIAEVLNTKNKSNHSVLHSAILGIKENQNWSVIGWLLQRGVDPKLKAEKINFSLKDKSVEDMFEEIDISYLKNYQKILEKFKNTENSEELISSLEVNPWIK